MLKNSKIYVGKVIHRRFKPKNHYFKYRVFSLLIDLDDLNEIDNKIKLFSYNKFNIISFFDKDHGDRDGTSLKNWVKKKLENIGIDNKDVTIKLFCYPRILGYVFNPLSVFFIYDKYDKIISIFYEVKNTFGEQHTYIFKAEDNETLRNSCVKKFHVSPFIDMECNYKFRVNKPSDKISVIIDQSDNDGKLLFALKNWVKKKLENIGIDNKEIKIKLFCYPRILGYVFNPLSVFFIYDKYDKIISIFYEVKNTFGEQHTYIFKAEDNETLRNSCVKKFHVSPFIDMECNYKFRVNKPSDKISVIIDQSDNDGKLLFASQDGTAKEFSNKNLFVSYIFHPLMTFKVIVAIHYEAFKLWLKGIKFIKKKINIKNNSSVEKSEFE